jgi:two-component system nitrogen regulation response regulator GlnG/two-component system response regulator HydG
MNPVSDAPTTPETDHPAEPGSVPRMVPALAVAWCGQEPWRMGEVFLGPEPRSREAAWIGRGAVVPGQRLRSSPGRLRLGQWEPSPPLELPALSRQQLSLQAVGAQRLRLENHGRCALQVNGQTVSSAEVAPGDLVQLGKQMLLICVRRTTSAPAWDRPEPPFPFGEPDGHGLVGESDVIWQLRRQIAMVAERPGHVLVTGATGTGKELVAQAIHARSPRSALPLVSRNAATLPETLIDAELFGNARNYPNPGMADRPGLIGEADRSTLFLDEFAELPASAQAHLLRVLDAGEYQRLGETRRRVADFRLVAATNREVTLIKHDVLARFSFQIVVPDLATRREDVPLLVKHLARDIRAPGGGEWPEVSLETMRTLMGRTYLAGVRELRALLWQVLTDRQPVEPAPAPATPVASEMPDALSPANIQRCLDQNNGAIEQTWRALGLSNRFALLRLIKRHDLEVRRRPGRGA